MCNGEDQLQVKMRMMRWCYHNRSQAEGTNTVSGEEAVEVEWQGPRVSGIKISLKYYVEEFTYPPVVN